jgi:hypothetical protein
VVTASTLVVKGSVGTSDQAKLTFNGLTYEGKGSVTRSFDAHEMPNGSYTAKIEKKIFFWDNKSSTFSLRTPPYSPKGVSASVSGKKLKVTWNLGPEPDLTGYEVSAGGAGSGVGSDDAMCAGTSCAKTFTIPSSVSGRVSVVVRARRSNGSGGTITSPASSAGVTVEGSSPGGGSNGGSGGSGGSGGYPDTGGAGSPLLPLTQDSPISLPTVAPDGATPGFQYPTPAPEVADHSPVSAPDARRVAAVNDLQWGKSIASALVLLIVAAHLGAWTRRVRVISGAANGSGMAARISRAGSGRARVRMAQASIAHAEAAAKAAELSQAAGKHGSRKAAKAAKKAEAAKAAAVAEAVDVAETAKSVNNESVNNESVNNESASNESVNTEMAEVAAPAESAESIEDRTEADSAPTGKGIATDRTGKSKPGRGGSTAPARAGKNPDKPAAKNGARLGSPRHRLGVGRRRAK